MGMISCKGISSRAFAHPKEAIISPCTVNPLANRFQVQDSLAIVVHRYLSVTFSVVGPVLRTRKEAGRLALYICMILYWRGGHLRYVQYGIDPQLVYVVKQRLKDPIIRERVKNMLQGVTREHLQDPATVRHLIDAVSSVIGVAISEQQAVNITYFVIDQKIDPNNMFHLIKLWNMFR